MPKFSSFSFGATSAVMTSLAIVVGFSAVPDAKITIVTTLLILAIADNISDSFGIHVHQESQHSSAEEVRKVTINNFTVRLIISFVFILFIMTLPIDFAVFLSVIFGIVIITVLSYFISKDQNANPYPGIAQHLALAVVVMVASFLLRGLTTDVISHFT